MRKRNFIELITLGTGAFASDAISGFSKPVTTFPGKVNLNIGEKSFMQML